MNLPATGTVHVNVKAARLGSVDQLATLAGQAELDVRRYPNTTRLVVDGAPIDLTQFIDRARTQTLITDASAADALAELLWRIT